MQDDTNPLKGGSVFVRNLSFETTDQDLETAFEDVGPLKSAFVVADGSGKSRGFGFVSFAMASDCAIAVEKLNNSELRGRKIKVEVASERRVKSPPKGTSVMRRSQESLSTIILIAAIPFGTDKAEFKNWVQQQTGFVPDCIVLPSPEITKRHSSARVSFDSPDTARKACNKLSTATFRENKVRVSPLDVKVCRLIVRNLSFKCSESTLVSVFSDCDPGVQAHIPLKPNGGRRGFGFIQFASLLAAQNAIRKNGTRICGRAVAVDWTLAKDGYVSRAAQALPSMAGGDVEDSDSDSGTAADVTKGSSGDGDLIVPGKGGLGKDVEQGGTIFIRNLAYDTTEQELEEYFGEFGEVIYAKCVLDKEMNRPKGTAFVLFKKKSSTQKALKRGLGAGISLGGRQLNVSIAVGRGESKMLEAGNSKTKKQDRRNLYLAEEGAIDTSSEIAKSMSKHDLEMREKANKERKAKLKNPNYLVSKTRLSVRNLPLRFDEKLLKKMFLSAAKKGREFVQGATKMKEQPIIKQAKIIRDAARIDQTGNARSKRYGFVEFKVHEDALAALRQLNNNPWALKPKATEEVDSESQPQKGNRLLVEFAVDDARKLFIQQKKREKHSRLLSQKKREKEEAETRAKEPLIADTAVSDSKGDEQPVGRKRKRKTRKKKTPSTEAIEIADEVGNHNSTPTAASPSGDGEQVTKKRKKKKRKKKAQDSIPANEKNFDKMVRDYKKKFHADAFESETDKPTKQKRWFD